MIPLRDHEYSGKTPVVTYTIIGLNILVFLYMLPIRGPALSQFYYEYGMLPAFISQGERLFTLITSMFIHGGPAHIIFNMWFLYIFGDNLEAAFGRVKFVIFYILCGVLASFAQILIDPSSTIPNVGASGAIAGVLGGYLVLFPYARIDVFVIFGFFARVVTVSAYYMLIYWIFFQVLFGVGSLGGMDDGVAYFAHIGGFASGWGILKGITRYTRWV